MDENKRNPLHYAAHKNNLKAITALLEESKKQGKNIVFVVFVHIYLFIFLTFVDLKKKSQQKSTIEKLKTNSALILDFYFY